LGRLPVRVSATTFRLPDFSLLQKQEKKIFLLVSTFDGVPFSVQEQIDNPRILGAASLGLQAIQQSFAKSLAVVYPSVTQLVVI